MRWVYAIACIAIACLMLFMSVPRLMASVVTLPAYATVSKMRYGAPVERSELERVAGYLEHATAWEVSGEKLTDLGLLRVLLAAETDESDPQRIASAAEATTTLREAISLRPAYPHVWVWLAEARALEGAPPEEVVALLEHSATTAPFVSEIFAPRLLLLLELWPHLSPELRSYTSQQIRYGWTNEWRLVIRIARSTSRPEIIRFALRPIPRAIPQLDRGLAASSS